MPDPAQTDSWKLFQTVAESIARDLSELPEVRKIALAGPYDRVNLTVVASGLKI